MALRNEPIQDGDAGPIVAAALLDPQDSQLAQIIRDAARFYRYHLLFLCARDPDSTSARERFEAFAHSVRDLLARRWADTTAHYEREHPKCVYYLSMEFLIGRSLANNTANLLLDPVVQQVTQQHHLEWSQLLEEEADAGLGNGGLGRLAACFLDSMTTLDLPAMGYGLRYEYGMFRQTIQNGWQQEQADHWLRCRDPWEVARPNEYVEVKFGCGIELRDGRLALVPNHPTSLIGVPFDRPVTGFGTHTINTLRLWAAYASESFDFQRFSAGDFVGALTQSLAAESLTRVLYPDDSTVSGRELRFVQEYFLVACSLADLVRRFKHANASWSALPDKVAIQLNDTHPALAVAELMRLLLDEAQLDWVQAWDLTTRSLAYTNHTLLPEALEKWPVDWFALLLPRHLQIIYEINQRFLDEVRRTYPGDEARVIRMSLIEEGTTRFVRMAHLAVVGSQSINGVSKIHTELLRSTTVKDFAEMFPERFSNKTNGVTPRRWLRLINPELSAVISETIGEDWVTDLSQLSRLRPLAEQAALQRRFWAAKRAAKARFSDWLARSGGCKIDPDTIYDCHIKRIHEYKRQLLNVLRIIVLYQRLTSDPGMTVTPRTFLFSGKAAPAYHLAKLIIKLINNVAAVIDEDPRVKGRLKVVFLPDYGVSLAEALIPAADVSNQISTAGYEASGTSNMKFMMNGALTIGTRDGATIEMAEEAGEENFFLFGLTAQQVRNSNASYNPYRHYEQELETRSTLDAIFTDQFSRHERGIFAPLREALLERGDHYMHLADLQSYLAADARLTDLYRERGAWSRKALLNIAGSGRFSSDRTIREYATEIWNAMPCPCPESDAA